MIAPITALVAVTCFLLAFVGLAIAVFAIIKYAKAHELSLMISAVALVWSAIALFVEGLTLLHHFS